MRKQLKVKVIALFLCLLFSLSCSQLSWVDEGYCQKAKNTINYPHLFFRMLKLETDEQFIARVMEAVKGTGYIRIRLMYAKRINCPGLPGGKRLEFIAVYYEREK